MDRWMDIQTKKYELKGTPLLRVKNMFSWNLNIGTTIKNLPKNDHNLKHVAPKEIKLWKTATFFHRTEESENSAPKAVKESHI